MALKVLMLGWELPPYNSGGLGEACQGLSTSLSEKGVDITFVLPHRVDLKVSHMKILFADTSEEIYKYPGAYASGSLVNKILMRDDIPPDFVVAAVKYAQKIGKIVKKYGPFDIIHVHDWMTYLAGIVAKESLNIPLIAHVHSTEIDRTGGIFPNSFVFEIERKGFEAADVVITVGGFMKDVLIGNYGVDPSKIHVIYNGIKNSKNELEPTLSKFKELGFKVVLFLGRITLQKGPEYFVRAAKKTLDYCPNTLFVVTGSGDMDQLMVSEASSLGILDKFIFTGFLRGEDRDRMFQSADVYVMPSISEPFGITALESIVNETPIIVSKTSGVSEILKNILKVDFWDTGEIANKIIAVLNFKSLKENLVIEGKREINTFTWGRSADQVMDVYKNLAISH